MSDPRDLHERAKELRCLYTIHDILRERAQSPVQAFARVVEAIPSGWQRPATAGARIEYLGRSYVGPGFCSTSPRLAEPIRVWGTELGRVEVSDTTAAPGAGEPTFLVEEAELLQKIAGRLGEYLEWKQTELLGGQPPAAGHWQWRDNYVRALAAQLDAERFGVAALYLGGSTGNGEAGPGSDIDLYVLANGTAAQRELLAAWLLGWSLCMAEVAVQQTGYAFRGGLLDVHWLTTRPDHREAAQFRELTLGASLR